MIRLTIIGFTPEDMLTTGVAAGGLGALVLLWVLMRWLRRHQRAREET